MNIAIIGGGAVGMLFAACLNEQHSIVLYTRTEKQSEEIRSNQLVYVNKQEQQRFHVDARCVSTFNGECHDLVIICVKQYKLEETLRMLKIRNGLVLLFIQNGMSHLQLIEKQTTNDTVLVGSVEHGAQKMNGYTVHHTGVGLTKLAYVRSKDHHSSLFLEGLVSHAPKQFQFEIKRSYREMLLEKLVVNAVINPLTAILQVRNGELLNNPYYHSLLTDLCREVTTVLGLPFEYYKNHVMHICETTSGNESSMLKDINNGRITEIDAISGFVLQQAKNRNIVSPLTLTLYTCIKGKEYERREID